MIKEEMVPLAMDRCAKILFGKKQNLDITTLHISSILKVDYDKLEGKIKFLPLSNPKDRKKSKKTEKDIVLLVEVDGKNQLMVLEFNYFRKDLENMFKNTLEDADRRKLDLIHKLKLDRNLQYLLELLVDSLNAGEDYTKILPAHLININTFSKYKKRKSNYQFVDIENVRDCYSKKLQITNIDIAESYKLVYNGKCEISNKHEYNLCILSAMLATWKYQEVIKLIEKLRTKEELKEKIKEVVRKMFKDKNFESIWYNRKDEQDRLDRSLLEAYRLDGLDEGKSEGRAEQQKDVVINSYKEKIPFETIAKICKLSLKQVNNIINDYKKNIA